MGDPDAWKPNSQKVAEFLFFAYQLPEKNQQMVDIFSIMMGGQPPENSGETAWVVRKSLPFPFAFQR